MEERLNMKMERFGCGENGEPNLLTGGRRKDVLIKAMVIDVCV